LARHGTTAWSALGRHTGRSDVPLSDEGREGARRLAAVLAPFTFSLVLTSPLSRATETCVLAGYGERAEVDVDLAEWDYGEAEGRTTEELRETRPGWTLWQDGVVGGESAADLGRRADRVIARARGAGGDTLCFAHGHLSRVLAARWVGLPPVGGRLLAFDAGAVGVLAYEREVPVIERWNERPR
jgi:probable phosphoglycerate mutase